MTEQQNEVADIATMRVMLALEQSLHNATKRELASVKAKLGRKPHVVKLAEGSFRPIAEADMAPGTNIIGYDQETGNIYRSHADYGSFLSSSSTELENALRWWVYGSGIAWNPTHFLPFPGDPA